MKSLTRRIIAISVTAITVAVLAYLAVWESSDMALGALITAFSLVTGYYFGAVK